MAEGTEQVKAVVLAAVAVGALCLFAALVQVEKITPGDPKPPSGDPLPKFHLWRSIIDSIDRMPFEEIQWISSSSTGP